MRSTCWRSSVELVGRNLAAIGDRQELQALINIGLGDYVTVHDRRRLDDRRHGRAEHLRVLWQLERMGRVRRRGRLLLSSLLGDRRRRRYRSQSRSDKPRAR